MRGDASMTPTAYTLTMISKDKILKWSSVGLLVCLLLTISIDKTSSQTQNAQNPQSEEARIMLTAIGNDGRFVSTLRAEDLRVLLDGVPQKIERFERVTDRTLSLAILIDTSYSQERTLPGQKLAANSFLDSVMRPGMDR